MRDPNRIPQVLDEIKKIWEKYPDMRLGQLIGNIYEGVALYYVEDSGLVNALKDVYTDIDLPVKFDEDAYALDLVKEHAEELGFVLQAKDYDEYVASYETVSEKPEEAAELTKSEYEFLKKYFTKAEE